MEKKHWGENLQMLALGALLGVAGTLVIGLKQEMLFTKAAVAEAVIQGEVLKLADVCVVEAKRDVTEQHAELAAFKGADNSKKREALVNTVISDLHIDKDLSYGVSSKCTELLS